MQHHGKTHGFLLLLLFPARLPFDTVQRPGGQVAVGVFDRHQAWLGGVPELMMRAFDPYQEPSVRFRWPDDLPTVHGGYYNYRMTFRIFAGPGLFDGVSMRGASGGHSIMSARK
jgi:hypothetical protein